MESLDRLRERGFTLIELMIVVAIIGILSVLAVFGVSRYLRTAKTAEALNSLGSINRCVVVTYTLERPASTTTLGAAGGASNRLCPSSAGAIPATPPKNQKYTADPAADYATDPGFSCLGFALHQPQYFSYDYVSGGPSKIAPAATVTGLTGWGTGAAADFNGDGVSFVEFATGGNLVQGVPVTSTAIASFDVASGAPL
ncbi:MAG: type IV pilin protein [Polyangiaceae bacterium]